jgi:polyisoprenoid-binding protein YceI
MMTGFPGKALPVLLLFLAVPLAAAPRTYSISRDGKNMTIFRYEDSIETVTGTAPGVSGSLTADVANPSLSSVEMSVELKGIDTGLAIRDSHIRDEFVQTGKYPRATFKSVSVAAPPLFTPNQPAEVQVTGDFTVHGITRRITIPVRVVVIPETDVTRSTRGPGDWVHATSTFGIKLSEYGIKVPETFIEDQIEIKLDVFGLAGRNQ